VPLAKQVIENLICICHFLQLLVHEKVSIDFVGGLPMCRKGHDYLYFVMDRFRKRCVLVPCKKQVTREKIAHFLFQHVWVHVGFPTSIVYDWDSRFLGEFWSTL
jgi:hypothetical protein